MRFSFRRLALAALLSLIFAAEGSAQTFRPPPLPFEVVATSGEKALAERERLRAEGEGWPVIVGDDEDLRLLAEFRSEASRDPGQALTAAETLDHPRSYMAFLARQSAEIDAAMLRNGVFTPAELEAWRKNDEALDEEVFAAPWPSSAEPMQGPYSVFDPFEERPLETVHIVVLPSMDPTEAPAHLRLGGWNAHPPAEHHVAAFRSWRERYGAVPVVVNGNTIEMRVSRRPETREEAMALATEMYRYDPDIILQGDGCVACLAASLMVSDWWYFWWD